MTIKVYKQYVKVISLVYILIESSVSSFVKTTLFLPREIVMVIVLKMTVTIINA